MTPKEKAKDLVDKYYHLFSVELENTITDYEAKECSLIAVDEILNYDNQFIQTEEQFNYWKEVKQEIDKL